MRTLLVGFSTEKTFRHTVDHMLTEGPAVDVLDFSLLYETAQKLRVLQSDGEMTVELDGVRFDFTHYSGFYNRAYWTELGDSARNTALRRLNRAVISWLTCTDATVVNRPGAGASNSNKFAHGLELQHLGFVTPRTYLVGDPLEAARLAHSGEELVSKSCSATKTRTIAPSAAFWERLDSLVHCPSVFQERIYGDEVRAHWVDGEIFAERIKTSRVDYRFADPSVAPNTHSPCEVPADIAKLCDAYCRSQSLIFVGFDFKVTAQGQWVALEANPMPGYESYDRRQDNRIARALAAVLSTGRATAALTGKQGAALSGWAMTPASRKPAPYGSSIYPQCPDDEADDISETLLVSSDRRPVVSPFYYAEPAPAGRR